MSAVTQRPLPAFPLFVRDRAQGFVLAQVEGAIGRLDQRTAGSPPTREAFALLGRVLAARVLRALSSSSQRPRLRALLGLRLEDEALAESLEQAWATATLTQALKDELDLIDFAYEDYLRALKLSSAGASGRGTPMLGRLPAFMRADRRGKALGEFVHALGRDLDEADRLLGRIRDAHALGFADEERDLLRLAASLGLQRADFLILAKLKDKGFFAADPAPGTDAQDRAAQAYALYTTDLRQAIGRFSRVMLRGCATVSALLEASMVLVNGDPRDPASPTRVPEADPRYPEPFITHPDRGLPRGGFMHGLPITFGTIEGEGEAMQRRTRNGFIYVVENPIVDKSSDDAERRGRDRLRVRRGGFFPGAVAARITGSGDRTVHPRLASLRTHRGLQFNGTVPDGQQLIFTTGGQAFLDGVDVTDQCCVFKGALFGGASFDEATPPHAFVRVVPPGALDRNFPRPTVVPESPLPTLRLLLGDTDWQFDVEEGAFDASAFGGCVFALPADDTARAALPPSAQVQLLWREHQPFTVRVLLPSGLQALEAALLDGESLRTLVHAGLERFRAAGVRLEVDWFDDTWVLDESVIRDSAIEAGLGVDFDGTVPNPQPPV